MYVATRKRKLRGLGCACRKGSLGQDIYDPVSGTYVPSLPSADNPVETFIPIEQQPYYTGDYEGPISAASTVASKAQVGTIFTPQSAPSLFQGATIAPSAQIGVIPGSISGSTPGLPSNFFSKYSGLIVLAVGLAAFVAVVKRR